MTGGKACTICNKSLGKKRKLNCGRCNGCFHLECGKVSEVDARLMQQEKTPWNCEDCIKTLADRRSTIYLPHSDSENFNELKSMLRDLQSEVRDMRLAMDFLNEKYEDERKRSKIMSDMFTEMTKDNVILKEKVSRLESALSLQENSKVKNNLCITGLVGENDSTEVKQQKVSKLLDYLQVQTREDDIKNFKQINTKSGPKIIITVANPNIIRKTS